MAKEFILQENVLTDNILMIPSKGKIFKGGFIAVIREFEFLNSWQDKEIITRFKSKESLNKYLTKHYPQAESDIDFEGTCLE